MYLCALSSLYRLWALRTSSRLQIVILTSKGSLNSPSYLAACTLRGLAAAAEASFTELGERETADLAGSFALGSLDCLHNPSFLYSKTWISPPCTRKTAIISFQGAIDRLKMHADCCSGAVKISWTQVLFSLAPPQRC